MEAHRFDVVRLTDAGHLFNKPARDLPKALLIAFFRKQVAR